MPTIENGLKELREERGWTQGQLAEAVGVSRQSINNIERDRYVPSLELAMKFANARHQSDDPIEAEAPACAGNAKKVVQVKCEIVEALLDLDRSPLVYFFHRYLSILTRRENCFLFLSPLRSLH